MINYYSILQIEEDASQEEIKQAYHRLARLFHPDNYNGSKELVEDQMARINEAYNVLSDKKKREIYDYERKQHSDNNSETQTPKKNSTPDYCQKEDNSPQYVKNEDNNTIIKGKELDNKKNSSCLGKLIEWAIYLGIVCFIFNRFNIGEKLDKLTQDNTSMDIVENVEQDTAEVVTDNITEELNPDEVVDCYLTLLKNGEAQKADSCFSQTADDNFQTSSVTGFNNMVTHLFCGLESDIPTYPLFEEIKKFKYKIVGVDTNFGTQTTRINVEMSNCDIVLIWGIVMASGYDIEQLSDDKCQEVFRNTIDLYKRECMIHTPVTFELIKNDKENWVINSISPLGDFGSVLMGQAYDIVLKLNGEETSGNVAIDYGYDKYESIDNSDILDFDDENEKEGNSIQTGVQDLAGQYSGWSGQSFAEINIYSDLNQFYCGELRIYLDSDIQKYGSREISGKLCRVSDHKYSIQGGYKNDVYLRVQYHEDHNENWIELWIDNEKVEEFPLVQCEILVDSPFDNIEAEENDDYLYDAEELLTDNNDEYVLPESSREYITESDLQGFDAYRCKIARNEIYARHGRIFSDEALMDYFNNMSWYIGELTAEEFDDSLLSDIERENLDTIVNYERKQGFR